MKNQLFFLFAASFILLSSCTADEGIPEVLGCMDSASLNFNADANTDDGSCEYLVDKIIGTWEADEFIRRGYDLIGFGDLKDVEFSFEDDFDFEWSGEGSNGTFYNGSGDWELDGDEIEIEFNSGSDYFCDQNLTGHDFEFDFNSTYSEIELEESNACSEDGASGIKIVLDRQ